MIRNEAGTRSFLHRLAVAAVAGAVALLAACGGGGGDDDLLVPPTDDTSTDSADSSFEEQTFTTGHELWHAGFLVTLGDGRHYAVVDEGPFADDPRYFVSLEASFENQGEDASSFTAETVLSAGGSFYEPTFESELPSVPGGLSGNGSFVFEVEEGFDLDDATLVIGAGGERRSEVALTSGEAPDTFEPQELDLAGELSLELLDLTLTGGGLRADRPVDHTQVDDGMLALTIEFDVLSRRDGNWTIQPEDFALTLPGGSSVVPEGAGLETLPGSEEGTLTSGLYLRFLVEDPAKGDYTLRFTAPTWFVGDDGVSEATVDFTLR